MTRKAGDMDKREKVMEVTARRMAARQGLRLARSRRRDPNAVDYGCYALFNASTDEPVLGVDTNGWYLLTLERAERYLRTPRKPIATQEELDAFVDEVIKHKKKWGIDDG
jgi:hypothetical protein